MKILVTGAAGFIGSAVAERLASASDEVTGIDNLNDYYDVRLKLARLRRMGIECGDDVPAGEVLASARYGSLRFIRMDIADKASLDALCERERFDVVVNLAAQAGVRYSISNPYSYLHSNIEGFLNILEACRHTGVRHLVFASSSSVYGMNSKVPYCESDKVDTPVSLYAASKKSNELMAHAYSKLYGFAVTGLRYFTVYGPWGRPDMSPMLFAGAILGGEPIKVFNHGDMMRDFTYIDDIVDGTVAVVRGTPEPDENDVLYHIYNIGGANSVKLMDFIGEIERACGCEARKIFLPMQPGDVYQTSADTTALEAATGLHAQTGLREGIDRFMQWYRSDENPLKNN
ncbi:MAG: NAD-dependent epimerase/dehydratase family protein [Muribaculaceae bacterium]|nr:NAD-dependent epimerase/dehydratase family protein [Muribaculaceae bacterium]